IASASLGRRESRLVLRVTVLAFAVRRDVLVLPRRLAAHAAELSQFGRLREGTGRGVEGSRHQRRFVLGWRGVLCNGAQPLLDAACLAVIPELVAAHAPSDDEGRYLPPMGMCAALLPRANQARTSPSRADQPARDPRSAEATRGVSRTTSE